MEDVFIPQEQIDKLAVRYVRKDDTVAQFAMATLKALLLTRIDPLQNVQKLDAPLFLLHGVNDWLLPPSGTIKVAKATAGPRRVWLMQNTGHAPESLEVNDLEYASQLQTFFKQAFQKKFVEPKLTFNAKRTALQQWNVELRVDCTEFAQQRIPVQIVLADERGRTFFSNELVTGKQDFAFATRFLPTHASVVQFQNVQNTAESWEPQLSEFSSALQGYREIAHLLFRSERTCEYLCVKGGEFFYTRQDLLGSFPKTLVQKLLTTLPQSDDLPDRIKARYAVLLARLDRWSELVKHNSDSTPSRIPLAEKMLEYLPDDPDGYYEIGNARFHLKFRDSVVAHSLYELAKARLVAGEPAQARELLRQHVATLPDWAGTNLTEERIASIKSLADLQKKIAPAD